MRIIGVWGAHILLMLAAQSLFAQEIKFELSFLKKPPKVGVLYALDGGSEIINQTAVDQINKQFDSPMYVKTPASTFLFKNSDTIDHNIYSKEKNTWKGFDIGLLPPGAQKESKDDFPEGSIVRLRCKIHPKMRAYVAEIPNASYQIIDFKKDGLQDAYSLRVSADTSKVGLIMPGYDPLILELSAMPLTEKITKKSKEKGMVKVSIQ